MLLIQDSKPQVNTCIFCLLQVSNLTTSVNMENESRNETTAEKVENMEVSFGEPQ